ASSELGWKPDRYRSGFTAFSLKECWQGVLAIAASRDEAMRRPKMSCSRGDMRGMKNPRRSHRPLNFSGAAGDHCEPLVVAAFRPLLERGIVQFSCLSAAGHRGWQARTPRRQRSTAWLGM